MPDVAYTGTKWVGPGLPFNRGNNGRFTAKTTAALIVSSIYHILTTKTGTRLMKPDFGSIFMDLVFEQNDAILAAELQVNVKNDILQWEPRIDTLSIKSSPNSDTVIVTISYTIRETGESVQSQITFQKNNQNSVKLVA